LLDVPDERRHLEARIDFLADPDEFASVLEKSEKVAEAVHDGVILPRGQRSRQGTREGGATLTLVRAAC
jgi:hypothetical protein